MKFADKVRESYTPAPEQKSDPDIYRRVAEYKVNLAKESLMAQSRSGQVTKLYTGLGILPQKVFLTGTSVQMIGSIKSVASLSFEGEPSGIGAHNHIEFRKLYAEMQRLCSAEGIRMRIYKSANATSEHFSVQFWIEV